MSELLIGCGSARRKLLCDGGRSEWTSLVTLDINEDHEPDVVHDLNELPLPFEDGQFDEIHAYEVLEHTGAQGDYRFFFGQWSEFWRLLKPGGMFFGSVPHWDSPWALGDPSHTRILRPEAFTFLSQPEYDRQVGVTAMSDFRWLYKADFDIEYMQAQGNMTLTFALRAIKPSRCTLP